jgi:hypothetical protein
MNTARTCDNVEPHARVNSIDCRSQNELYLGELGNWRVRRATPKLTAATTR